jgi:hypothetical protein
MSDDQSRRLSERQNVTALRLASVPIGVFVRQVESSAPPSLTRVATGKQRQPAAALFTRVIAMSALGSVELLNCSMKSLPAGRSNSTIL